MYCNKAENAHFLRQCTWTNIYYPDPSTTREFQSLYANAPYFKEFLQLYQKAKISNTNNLSTEEKGTDELSCWQKEKTLRSIQKMWNLYLSWNRPLLFPVIAKPVPR